MLKVSRAFLESKKSKSKVSEMPKSRGEMGGWGENKVDEFPFLGSMLLLVVVVVVLICYWIFFLLAYKL